MSRLASGGFETESCGQIKRERSVDDEYQFGHVVNELTYEPWHEQMAAGEAGQF